MLSITPVSTFSDNYVWIIANDNAMAIVVDPGDAAPVKQYLDNHGLALHAILITHHHADHTGGIQALVADYSPVVYGPEKSTIQDFDHRVNMSDNLAFPAFNLELEVIATPGHTLDHVCYYAPSMLFCGDTLFSGGCGRVFEGNAKMMYESLQLLAQLPEDTRVFCAHEYTLANLAFAQTIDPNNDAILTQIERVKSQISDDLPSLPSTLKIEKTINPFLRTDNESLIANLTTNHGLTSTDPVAVFTLMRQLKDTF